MSDGTLHFATICSNEYLPYFYTLLCSIRKNHSEHIVFHVVTQNITSENRCELEKFGASNDVYIDIIYVNDAYLSRFTYFDSKVLGRYPRTLFCVLTLSDLIDNSVSRVLFMEVDTVVDSSILDMYNIDFDSNLIAGTAWGIPSNQYISNSAPYTLEGNIIIDGTKVHDHHVNTGAVLFNLSGMRKKQVSPEYYLDFKNCKNPEQYLGAAFGTKMIFLNPIRFNYRTSWEKEYKKMGLSGDISIIHYVNRSINAIYRKPWQILFKDNELHYVIKGCPDEAHLNSVIHSTFKIWWKYAEYSPYYNELKTSADSELMLYNKKIDSILSVCEDLMRNQMVQLVDAKIRLHEYGDSLRICEAISTKDGAVYARMYYLIKEYNQKPVGTVDETVLFKKSDGNYFAKIGKNSPDLDDNASLKWMGLSFRKGIYWASDIFIERLKKSKSPKLTNQYSEHILSLIEKGNVSAYLFLIDECLCDVNIVSDKDKLCSVLTSYRDTHPEHISLKLADLFRKINTKCSKSEYINTLLELYKKTPSNPKICVLISRAYRDGIGVVRDLVESSKFMKIAADQNYEWSKNEYFDILWKINTPDTDREMVDLAKTNAMLGNTGSMRRLGQAYCSGRGVSRDIDQAIYWMNKKYEVDGPYLEYAELLLMRNGDEDIRKVFDMVNSDNSKSFVNLFHKGYLISDSPLDSTLGWEEHHVVHESHDFYIYNDPLLKYTLAKDDNGFVCILGEVIDVSSEPADGGDIAINLLNLLSISEKSFFEYTDYLAGSYVIFYAFGSSEYIIQDATGSRPVFFNKSRMLISSYDLLIRYYQFENHSKWYYEWFNDGRRKWTLPGNCTPYENIFALIPNHALDVNTMSFRRFWPTHNVVPIQLESYVDIAKDILLRESKAIAALGPVLIQVTGGRDSRISLAAFYNSEGKINTVTYVDRNKTDRRAVVDSKYAASISAECGLDHKIVCLLTDEIYKIKDRLKYFSCGRLVGESLHSNYDSHSILIRSNLIEIVRKPRFWDNLPIFEKNTISSKDLNICSGWDEASSVMSEFEEYCELMEFSSDKLFDYDPQTIFYWEYRMSLWANKTISFDENQYFDTYMLFNCRKLLDLGLGLSESDLEADKLVCDLVEKMCPPLKDKEFCNYLD